MKTFSKKVNLKSRKQMVSFLSNHFRYNTMNSWNKNTSYAHNMKIYNLGLSSEIVGKLYDLMQIEQTHLGIADLIRCFDKKHNYAWRAGFNGRSNGYLVLYQGGVENGREFSTGKEIDQDEDFTEWDTEDLKKRVKLIQDFDSLADAIVKEVVYLAENYEVEEEEIQVPKKIKVLKEKTA